GPVDAGHEFDRRRGVVVLERVARVQKRQVIDVACRVRQQVGHPGARFAVLCPGEGRLETFAAGGEVAALRSGAGELLAVAALQFGLVVEEIDLRRAAGHEQPDDRLYLGRKVSEARTLLAGALLMEQRRQRQRAESRANRLQKAAAGGELDRRWI